MTNEANAGKILADESSHINSKVDIAANPAMDAAGSRVVEVPDSKGSELVRLSNTLNEVRLSKVKNTEFFGSDLKQLRSPGAQTVQLPNGSFKRLKVDVFQSTIQGDSQTAIKFFDAVSGKKTNVNFSNLGQGPKELARFEIDNRVFTLRGSSKEFPTVEVKTFFDNKIVREKIRFGDIQ